MASLVKKQYRFELKQVDWDFSDGNGSTGFSAYHWYPARYVPQIAGTLINYFSEPGDVVLDPFCGSGTTLVEALKFGRPAVGIDINPVAVLMTKAKLIPIDESSFSSFVEKILTEINSTLIETHASRLLSIELDKLIPNYQENSLWYEVETLRELACIWKTIHSHNDSEYFLPTLSAFSAILKYCCSQEKHWGWVCDNVKPAKLLYKDAIKKYTEKLLEFQMSAKAFHEEVINLQEKHILSSEIEVFQGSCPEKLQQLSNRMFDLVVTSPPYFSMTDYIHSQRLSFLWLDFDTKSLRVKEVGARYRRRNKDSLAEYLKMMKDSFSAITKSLKKGKYCCVVIGESPKHEPYLDKFQAICGEVGLALCESFSRSIGQKRSLWPVLERERIFIFKRKR